MHELPIGNKKFPLMLFLIVKRYLRNVGTFEGCFLIRDGEKIPLEGIKDYQVLNDNGFLE